MDSTMDLDQLAIMLVVLVVMGTVICTVGAVLSCFSRSHNESRLESRGIGTPNIPAWWRNVSGTADLDGYYTDEPDGFGLGLAGLRGQGAWDAAGTRSSFVSHDSDRVSRFIWEHQSPSSFRWVHTSHPQPRHAPPSGRLILPPLSYHPIGPLLHFLDEQDRVCRSVPAVFAGTPDLYWSAVSGTQSLR